MFLDEMKKQDIALQETKRRLEIWDQLAPKLEGIKRLSESHDLRSSNFQLNCIIQEIDSVLELMRSGVAT